MLLQDPIRPVAQAEVETFWRDGVVLLRGILDTDWLDALAGPLEQTISQGESVNLGIMAPDSSSVSGSDSNPDAPAFSAGTDHWRHDPTFLAFATTSPLAPIAETLLNSEQIWLWEDSVLVKEAGSPFVTKFHTDASYFNLEGDQVCTMWIPLDAATPSSGVVSWVRGSHRDPVEYRPNMFVTDEPIPGTKGESIPDVLGTPELSERLISFDLEPGDLTVHHARTLHGSPANTSEVRRRAVSMRYFGDDARCRHKPGIMVRSAMSTLSDGDPLGPPDCPLAWPR